MQLFLGEINDEIKKLNLGVGTDPEDPRKLANAIISIFNIEMLEKKWAEMPENAQKIFIQEI